MMRFAKMDRGMADIALQPANELIHDMAFEMQDLQTTMYDALKILQTLAPTADEWKADQPQGPIPEAQIPHAQPVHQAC